MDDRLATLPRAATALRVVGFPTIVLWDTHPDEEPEVQAEHHQPPNECE
ncbi:hypothetical protein [Natronococcus sp.]|nr:hypothetical protein [Natronococcus sp.]